VSRSDQAFAVGNWLVYRAERLLVFLARVPGARQEDVQRLSEMTAVREQPHDHDVFLAGERQRVPESREPVLVSKPVRNPHAGLRGFRH
jgi:hypothetical protein